MTEVPDQDVWEMLYKTHLHFSEELRPLVALYLPYAVQKGEAASCSQLKELVRRYVEQNIRENNFHARNEDRSPQGAAAWKGNPKGNLGGSGKDGSKDPKHGDCNQWTWKGTMFTERLVQLQARRRHKENRDQTKILCSVRNEKTVERKRTRRCQRERMPQGLVCRESQIRWSALIAGEGNAKNNPLAIVGTHRNTPTASPEVDATGRTRVYSSTQGQRMKGTIATKPDEAKEFNCVLYGGHTITFSVRSILRKIGGSPTKKQFRVRYCRNAERHFRSRERRGPS